MSIFKFKFFDVKQSDAPMKVGTDAMVLGSFVDSSGKVAGLDVGAGTGVLSLMLAQRNTGLNIEAIELDELASLECAFNFSNSNYSKKLKVVQIDFLDFQPTNKYDLIVSNPPYFQTRLENEDLRKSNSRHERSLPKSLFIRKVAKMIMDDGDFWIIIPFIDVEGWVEEAQKNGLNLIDRIDVQGKQNGDFIRSIIRFAKRNEKVNVRKFTIRNEANEYTPEYIELTSDFHFKDLKKEA